MINGILKLCVIMFTTGVIYIVSSFILKIEYLKDLKDRIKAKWKKA